MEKIEKFVKKPVEIDAVNFDGSDKLLKKLEQLWGMEYQVVKNPEGIVRKITITTDSGEMLLNMGDWIIRGVKGEIYPCNAEVFDLTYEKAKIPRIITKEEGNIDPIECHEPCPEWKLISKFFSKENAGKSACRAYKKNDENYLKITPICEMDECPLGKWVREGEENGK